MSDPTLPVETPPNMKKRWAYRAIDAVSNATRKLKERFGILEGLALFTAGIVTSAGGWLFLQVNTLKDQQADLKRSQDVFRAETSGMVDSKIAMERKEATTEAEMTKRMLHNYQMCSRVVSLLHSQRCASGKMVESHNQLAILFNTTAQLTNLDS